MTKKSNVWCRPGQVYVFLTCNNTLVLSVSHLLTAVRSCLLYMFCACLVCKESLFSSLHSGYENLVQVLSPSHNFVFLNKWHKSSPPAASERADGAAFATEYRAACLIPCRQRALLCRSAERGQRLSGGQCEQKALPAVLTWLTGQGRARAFGLRTKQLRLDCRAWSEHITSPGKHNYMAKTYINLQRVNTFWKFIPGNLHFIRTFCLIDY